MSEEKGGEPLASNTEWIAWGKRDPLWAVATWEGKERGTSGAWTEEDFYKQGESDWREFERRWKAYGYVPESCLEIGCGAGRFTRNIARVFNRVEAVDVSPDQVAIAKRNVPTAVFHVTNGIALPLPDASILNCFTAHVLQHLDSPRVLAAYLREMFRVMQPTGSLMAHLPLYVVPYGHKSFGGLLRRMIAVKRWQILWRDRTLRRLSVPVMRHTPVESSWLLDTLRAIGFVQLEFSGFSVQSNGEFHWFVMGRKP